VSATHEFTCEVCKGTFVSDDTPEEIRAEFEERFPGEPYVESEVGSVCDGCDAKLMAWLRSPLAGTAVLLEAWGAEEKP
jgi:hypothetical protein